SKSYGTSCESRSLRLSPAAVFPATVRKLGGMHAELSRRDRLLMWICPLGGQECPPHQCGMARAFRRERGDDSITTGQLSETVCVCYHSVAAVLSGSSSAVERQLPKLDVTGSIPVSRSNSAYLP